MSLVPHYKWTKTPYSLFKKHLYRIYDRRATRSKCSQALPSPRLIFLHMTNKVRRALFGKYDRHACLPSGPYIRLHIVCEAVSSLLSPSGNKPVIRIFIQLSLDLNNLALHVHSSRIPTLLHCSLPLGHRGRS